MLMAHRRIHRVSRLSYGRDVSGRGLRRVATAVTQGDPGGVPVVHHSEAGHEPAFWMQTAVIRSLFGAVCIQNAEKWSWLGAADDGQWARLHSGY
jgi:hypothetical protein